MMIGSYTVPGRCGRARQGSTDAWLLLTPVPVRSWERRVDKSETHHRRAGGGTPRGFRRR